MAWIAHFPRIMAQNLKGKRVAFLVDEMFEDSEFRVPWKHVEQAGCKATIVGLEQGKKLTGKTDETEIEVDRSIDGVSADDFDALVIPGGYSPDKLRTSKKVVAFVCRMVESGKPVAAICHAGWLLAEAGVARGRTLTSWPSIRTDLVNAGATWVDREVVVDRNLVTSRKPEDLDAFSKALLDQMRYGPGRRASANGGEQRASR